MPTPNQKLSSCCKAGYNITISGVHWCDSCCKSCTVAPEKEEHEIGCNSRDAYSTGECNCSPSPVKEDDVSTHSEEDWEENWKQFCIIQANKFDVLTSLQKYGIGTTYEIEGSSYIRLLLKQQLSLQSEEHIRLLGEMEIIKKIMLDDSKDSVRVPEWEAGFNSALQSAIEKIKSNNKK